ncbi:MAG: hypothetical protein R3283_07240 [Balneolaceae bacterium]|nr:hypothetical protein [Balneolaceae bacterium]
MRTVHLFILIFSLSLIPLIFGIESLLLFVLPGGLPLGTLLAAIALITGSAIPMVQSNSNSILWWISVIILIPAILWLPLGIYLSGNAALNFVQDATDSLFFWRFTTGLAVLMIASILWTAVEVYQARRD